MKIGIIGFCLVGSSAAYALFFRKSGFETPNSVTNVTLPILAISVSTLPNRYPTGGPEDGYMTKIPEVGSSCTDATTWEEMRG